MSDADYQRNRYWENPEKAREETRLRQEKRRRRLGIQPRKRRSPEEQLAARKESYKSGSRRKYYEEVQKEKTRERRLIPEGRCRFLIQGAKDRSKKQGIEFDLTLEWILERWTGFCELTGLPFKLEVNKRDRYSPSIDRIDPTKGYTQENCRLVLWAINTFKGDGDDKTMFDIATALIAYRDLSVSDPPLL